jgi:formate--tetrahydrofolate ligase
VKTADLNQENVDALRAGLSNLERHVTNIRDHYGVSPVVSINRFSSDTQAEIDALMAHCETLGVPVALASHWADGGAGAQDLAHKVVEICETDSGSGASAHDSFVYPDSASLLEKVEMIATKIYGASEVTASTKVRNRLRELTTEGHGHLPVCIAKTQYSFSTDPQLLGAPSNHAMDIREVRLSVGAGFIVVVCGDIMTMPGLPKIPASENIDVVEGQITGLF